MRRFYRVLFAGLLTGVASFSSASGALATNVLDWEVVHRFRLISDPSNEDRFLSRVFSGKVRTSVLSGVLGRGDANAEQASQFRFPTAWNERMAQYDHDWYHNTARTIRVRLPAKALVKAGLRGGALKTSVCEYKNGEATPVRQRCGEWAELKVRLGKNAIGYSIDGTSARGEESVEVRDVKIASLGDSYSSGEGNPHTRHFQLVADTTSDPPNVVAAGSPAAWLDHRCHRSLLSAPALAAARMALSDKKRSVTFVSFACSGAEVDDGVLEAYVGRETPFQVQKKFEQQSRPAPQVYSHPKLVRQLEALQRLMCRDKQLCAQPEPLDMLVIGTGGNEVGFGSLVRTAYAGQLDKSNSASLARIRAEFERVRKQMQELRTRIAALQPARTMLLSYLDPTRSENGFCHSSFGQPAVSFFLEAFGVKITAAESRFVARNVLAKLEELHKSVAKESNWTFVGDFSRKHGFCAQKSFFHDLRTSTTLQGDLVPDPALNQSAGFPTGVFHPNVFGHLHVSGRLFDLMRAP